MTAIMRTAAGKGHCKQLKPCPICGSRWLRIHSGYPLNVWSIHCQKCGLTLRRFENYKALLRAWNERYYDDDDDA